MMCDVRESALRAAAARGVDAFVRLVADTCLEAAGGRLTRANMGRISDDQHTLLAYMTLRDALLQGGFCRLVRDGNGAYILHNPVAGKLRDWGIDGLANLLDDARPIYDAHREDLERKRTDEEFRAMYEQHKYFDPLDEDFLKHEEAWTEAVARYVDDHLDDFVLVLPDADPHLEEDMKELEY